ncbi:MAG: efflux RND transporter permease subunit, partial [Actinomycetota bacterium]
MLRSIVTFFVTRPALTVALWVGAVVFGVLAYTTLLPREGFPSVDVPVAVASGAYLVDDPEVVDADVAAPLAGAVAEQDQVEAVQSFAQPSSFSVVAEFEEGVTSLEGTEIINDALARLDLPDEAIVSVNAINAAKFLEEYDLLIGVHGEADSSAEELEAAATSLLPALEDEADR